MQLFREVLPREPRHLDRTGKPFRKPVVTLTLHNAQP